VHCGTGFASAANNVLSFILIFLFELRAGLCTAALT
jgi:hypothetical protein